MTECTGFLQHRTFRTRSPYVTREKKRSDQITIRTLFLDNVSALSEFFLSHIFFFSLYRGVSGVSGMSGFPFLGGAR